MTSTLLGELCIGARVRHVSGADWLGTIRERHGALYTVEWDSTHFMQHTRNFIELA